MTPKQDYHRATPEPISNDERKSQDAIPVRYLLFLGAIVVGVMLLAVFVILPAIAAIR